MKKFLKLSFNLHFPLSFNDANGFFFFSFFPSVGLIKSEVVCCAYRFYILEAPKSQVSTQRLGKPYNAGRSRKRKCFHHATLLKRYILHYVYIIVMIKQC